MVDLQESMLLWVPVSRECPEESDELIQQVTIANGAVMDFCDGIITLEDAFDVIHDNGADIDAYIADLAQTISAIGA